MDYPLQRNIHHRFTKGRPLLIRPSKVRIRHKAVVHIKRGTLLGTFPFQIPFQGKMEIGASQISW